MLVLAAQLEYPLVIAKISNEKRSRKSNKIGPERVQQAIFYEHENDQDMGKRCAYTDNGETDDLNAEVAISAQRCRYQCWLSGAAIGGACSGLSMASLSGGR